MYTRRKSSLRAAAPRPVPADLRQTLAPPGSRRTYARSQRRAPRGSGRDAHDAANRRREPRRDSVRETPILEAEPRRHQTAHDDLVVARESRRLPDPGRHRVLQPLPRREIRTEHDRVIERRRLTAAAEGEGERARPVPQPHLVTRHDVPRALLPRRQQVVDARGRRPLPRGRLDGVAARPHAAEPPALRVPFEIEEDGGGGTVVRHGLVLRSLG